MTKKGSLARHGAQNLMKVEGGERAKERETREELSEVYLERVDGGYKYRRGRRENRFSHHGDV